MKIAADVNVGIMDPYFWEDPSHGEYELRFDI